MTDYTELVKALRCKSLSKECDPCNYGYRLCPDSECNDACDVEQIYADAAAAIEALEAAWIKSETDATNLTGRLAQAEADVERLNREIDKRIATEIELSNSLDAANHHLKMYSMCPFDDEEDEG